MVREGSFYLRVKIKSLSEEVRIIRHEMRKTKKSYKYLKAKAKEAGEQPDTSSQTDLRVEADRFGWAHNSLVRHMADVVKTEYRSALLALAFLKGKPYSSVERFTRKRPDWGRIERLVKKYYPMRFFNDPHPRQAEMDELWNKWLQEAREHIYVTHSCQPHLTEKMASEGIEDRRQKLAEAKESGKPLYAFPYSYVCNKPEPKPTPHIVPTPTPSLMERLFG